MFLAIASGVRKAKISAMLTSSDSIWDNKLIATNESPPKRMKSSYMLTFSKFNAFSKASTTCLSFSFLGATYSACKTDKSTSGKERLSTLPLTFKGISSNRMTKEGIIYSGLC